MNRRLRPVAALALIVLLGLIGVGCGSNVPSETGTTNGTVSSAGAGTGKNATGQDKTVKFAECMRANGVPHFPDANAKGEFVFGIDVSPAVWARAVNACKALQPPGTLSATSYARAADGKPQVRPVHA